MTTYRAFHSQLTSIMEALARAAVAEICELVDESYAGLRLEVSRSRKENEALRRKLLMIETIIARGYHQGGGGVGGGDGFAMLGYGGPEEGEGGGEEGEEPPPQQQQQQQQRAERLPPGGGAIQLSKGCSLKRDRKSAADAGVSEDGPYAAEEGGAKHHMVVVKEEDAKLEVDGGEEMLLEGAELRTPAADDSDEGPSGMTISSADAPPWDRTCAALSEPADPPDSPGPGEAAEGDSPGLVFDLSSEADSEAAAPPGRTAFGATLPGTSEPKPGASTMGPAPFDPEPEPCPLWPGLPGAGPASHGLLFKPGHLPALLDKVSDLNAAAGFPLALGLGGGSRLDPLDLNRYCRDRRFLCSYCGKCFTSSRSLDTHVRVHTGERPYSCPHCGKRFTQSGHLKTHQSVHTGERPFACEHCSKRFAGKQNLRIHQQKHHQGAASAATAAQHPGAIR